MDRAARCTIDAFFPFTSLLSRLLLNFVVALPRLTLSCHGQHVKLEALKSLPINTNEGILRLIDRHWTHCILNLLVIRTGLREMAAGCTKILSAIIPTG